MQTRETATWQKKKVIRSVVLAHISVKALETVSMKLTLAK